MELEDHLADREAEIANEKADRKDLIDSDRPNWRNSLSDLLKWQDRHGVQPEEMTPQEGTLLMIAQYLTIAEATKLLNASVYYNATHCMVYFTFHNDLRQYSHIMLDANSSGVMAISSGIYASGNEPISAGSVKSFFSND